MNGTFDTSYVLPHLRTVIQGIQAGNFVFTSVDDDYDVLATDLTLYVPDNASTITLNLPTAVGITGKFYIVKSANVKDVLIIPDGSETIDGGGSLTLAQYDCYTLQSDGANWIIIAKYP